MHYRKYRLRSPLFALRNPKLSEQILATFSGAAQVPLRPCLPPRRRQAAPKETG